MSKNGGEVQVRNAKLSAKLSGLSNAKCEALLRRAGCPFHVIIHCRSVMKLAQKLARALAKVCEVDLELVRAGAMLHDLGRAVTHGVRHGAEGGKLARELGLPPPIVRIIERHIGAGISQLEAPLLGLPPGDYVPRTLEEKIVCHADNLIDHNRRQKLEDCMVSYEACGRADIAWRIQQLHAELSKLCGVNLDVIE
jgi:uncharacterized protein (TIGR00295 family)